MATKGQLCQHLGIEAGIKAFYEERHAMSEDVAKSYSVDGWLTRIGNTVAATPIDWSAIRCATTSLEGEARTKDQKAAVEELKRAAEGTTVQRAASAVERAFLDGKLGADGWPRKA
jgi:hypothetical protein